LALNRCILLGFGKQWSIIRFIFDVGEPITILFTMNALLYVY